VKTHLKATEKYFVKTGIAPAVIVSVSLLKDKKLVSRRLHRFPLVTPIQAITDYLLAEYQADSITYQERMFD